MEEKSVKTAPYSAPTTSITHIQYKRKQDLPKETYFPNLFIESNQIRWYLLNVLIENNKTFFLHKKQQDNLTDLPKIVRD